MRFVRLYTRDDGQSHFEDMDDSTVFFKTHPANSIIFKSDQSAHIRDWHPAPRRQYVITLAGSVDIRIGDGTVMTFGPGDVFLAEDLTGQGHIAVPKNWVRAFIPTK